LKVESEILGVFDVQSDRLNAFDEDDLLVLRVLADNIALAIKTTRLFEAVKQQAERLETVAEASRAITLILDTDELLEQIVNLMFRRFYFNLGIHQTCRTDNLFHTDTFSLLRLILRRCLPKYIFSGWSVPHIRQNATAGCPAPKADGIRI